MRTWNATLGQRLQVHFSPTDWQHGATPSYGEHPQQALNSVIVDNSDVAIVIFTDRLGTPTKSHPSGTVEEIERLHKAGKRVAILVNRVPDRSLEGKEATAEKGRLEEYLRSIQNRSFYREYRSRDELTQVINTLLQEIAVATPAPDGRLNDAAKYPHSFEENPAIGVWPSMEDEHYSEADSKGRLKNKRRSFLVLANKTGVPVTHVTYQYVHPDGEPHPEFDLRTEGAVTEVGTIPPDKERRLPLWRGWQAGEDADCVVTWTAPDGSMHATRSTVA
ncbi:hypothetical protein AABM36_02555 [Kocuria sp. KSNUG]|uniref:hypothetical protein n=1 Tax=Kocuria sp. KSNUG TaxID=3136676 RepID=UPI003C2FB682